MNYLELLGLTPFADRAELAAMSGVSIDSASRAVRRLERDRLAVSFESATGYGRASRRYYLSGAGVRRLGESLGGLQSLRDRYPLSRRWRRALLARLDAVAAVYRLAACLASGLEAGPLRVYHWMRGPLEATIRLETGETIGVMRKGAVVSQRSFDSSVWRLARSGWGHRVPIVALALTDLERDYLSSGPLRRFFDLRFLVGFEYELFDTASGQARFRASFGEDRALRPAAEWKDPLRSGKDAPDFGWAYRWSDTDQVSLSPERGARSKSVELNLIEKRLIDLVYDWPLGSRRSAAAALGVTERRLRSAVGKLVGAGLLRADRDDGDGLDRLVLTDRAIEYICGRDRVYSASQKSSLSAEPGSNGSRYQGSALRAALRELDHHDGLYEFLSRMRSDMTTDVSWIEIEPTSRSTRSFRFNGRLERLTADALARLRMSSGYSLTLMIEYERRASRPSTMLGKVRPYRRYFESGAAARQMGEGCVASFVFERGEQETLFLRRLYSDRKRYGFSIPAISTVASVLSEHGGPYGPVWRIGGALESAERHRLGALSVVGPKLTERCLTCDCSRSR